MYRRVGTVPPRESGRMCAASCAASAWAIGGALGGPLIEPWRVACPSVSRVRCGVGRRVEGCTMVDPMKYDVYLRCISWHLGAGVCTYYAICVRSRRLSRVGQVRV